MCRCQYPLCFSLSLTMPPRRSNSWDVSRILERWAPRHPCTPRGIRVVVREGVRSGPPTPVFTHAYFARLMRLSSVTIAVITNNSSAVRTTACLVSSTRRFSGARARFLHGRSERPSLRSFHTSAPCRLVRQNKLLDASCSTYNFSVDETHLLGARTRSSSGGRPHADRDVEVRIHRTKPNGVDVVEGIPHGGVFVPKHETGTVCVLMRFVRKTSGRGKQPIKKKTRVCEYGQASETKYGF